jgi:two-component system sensor kinase FixL
MSHGETERRVESLQRLINEANALALVGSREHGIDVQVSLDPAADLVFVDRIQIQQVLVNLIRNAIDAMVDSAIRSLAIRTARLNDGFVRVTVEDTGTGIDETIAPQLFQPFVTSKESGMGIGLSICRTIVESHGGRIWFEPGEQGGTEFHFTLPTGDAKS